MGRRTYPQHSGRGLGGLCILGVLGGVEAMAGSKMETRGDKGRGGGGKRAEGPCTRYISRVARSRYMPQTLGAKFPEPNERGPPAATTKQDTGHRSVQTPHDAALWI